jgi:subtilase family serine protease
MSFGESESYLAYPAGLDDVKSWSDAFQKARKQHVTLFASSADNGVDTGLIYSPNVSWPASSPLVTSVGGTNLFFGVGTAASPSGAYLSEQVWNDGYGASGGGMSILNPEPNFQSTNLPKSVSTLLHNYRGVPDVAYNAGVVGGVIVAWSATVPGGFYIFGGTSAGSPQWAGLTADLDEALGHPLGFLNPRLYALGGAGALAPLFHDITLGDNTNYVTAVPGYPATPGYDLSTGWGTPNFGKLGAILADPNGDEDASSAP